MQIKNLQALRERRSALAADIHKLLDDHAGDKWNAEVAGKVNAMTDDVHKIDDQIAVIQKAVDSINAANSTEALRDKHTRTPGAHGGDPERSRDLRAFLSGGYAALGAEGIARMQQRTNPDIRAAMSTTTNSEGGFTVATEYMRELEEAMKAFGGIRQVARVIRTATGADMNFPTADATAEVGEIVGQNAAVTLGETTFGNSAMSVYKYSSKKIALPFELIQDSFIDIDGYVQDVLAMRIGRITSTHFTTGTGTAQPRGVVTGSALGKTGTTGQTATVIYDDLVDLEHSVDPAYRAMPSVAYMMHDQSLKVVRKIKDTQGRPIFVPGYEQGNPGGAPDTLLGRRIVISQEMPTMAANAKSILFGAFSKYIIREVMDLTLFRMTDSAFTLNGQVGFVAFNRQGGNLIDAGGAVKHYANSAT